MTNLDLVNHWEIYAWHSGELATLVGKGDRLDFTGFAGTHWGKAFVVYQPINSFPILE